MTKMGIELRLMKMDSTIIMIKMDIKSKKIHSLAGSPNMILLMGLLQETMAKNMTKEATKSEKLQIKMVNKFTNIMTSMDIKLNKILQLENKLNMISMDIQFKQIQ